MSEVPQFAPQSGPSSVAELAVRVEHPQPDAAVVVLLDEHDVSTRPVLESLVETLLAENDLVVVDLSEVEFVDSSIVNLLLETKQIAPECACVFRVQVGTSAVVHRLLEITGVLVLLDWAPTRERALNG